MGQTHWLLHGLVLAVMDVQGCIRRGRGGGLNGWGSGGLAGTLLLPGSPYGPRRMRRKIFGSWNPLGTKAKKKKGKFFLAVSLEHWNGRRGGGGGGLLLRCTAVLIHHRGASLSLSPQPRPLRAGLKDGGPSGVMVTALVRFSWAAKRPRRSPRGARPNGPTAVHAPSERQGN